MNFYVNTAGTITPHLPARAVSETPKALISASVLMGPQTVKILDHLRKIGDISGVEAAAMYRARSLTKRVAELRGLGFGIESVFSKDHTGQRYVRYFLREDRKEVVA